MDPVFILNSLALGIGLAMDAFSVSLANGLHERNMKQGRMAMIAGLYAFFQFAMPLIGWISIRGIEKIFSAFEKMVPWITLILLLFLGIRMIREGVEEKKTGKAPEGPGGGISFRLLLLQAFATSVDALSAGFTLAEYRAGQAVLAAGLIGGVTFLICLAGLLLGRKVGTKLSWGASVLGGVILILIGVRIFLSHL